MNKLTDERPPRISVILPLYNAEQYIALAVKSVLQQTYGDFELLVINDGSTDRSLAAIAHLTDSRLRILENPKNLGLIATLNRGISEARGEFIARMDADDICHPKRFEEQIRFFEQHPQIDVLGTDIYLIDEYNNLQGRPIPPPEDSDIIKWTLLRRCCLYHPTIMAKTEILRRAGGYDSKFRHCEDYELWLRLSKSVEFAVLPKPLLFYRQHPKSVSSVNLSHQARFSARALKIHVFANYGLVLKARQAIVLLRPNLISCLSHRQAKDFVANFRFIFQQNVGRQNLSIGQRRLIEAGYLRFNATYFVYSLTSNPYLAPVFFKEFFKVFLSHLNLTVYLLVYLAAFITRRLGIKEKFFFTRNKSVKAQLAE